MNSNMEGFSKVTDENHGEIGLKFDVIVKNPKTDELICSFTSEMVSFRYRGNRLKAITFGSIEGQPVSYTAGIKYGLNVDTGFCDIYIREHSDDVSFETTITF